MTTKDEYSAFKHKQKFYVDSSSSNNFNLNQGRHQYSFKEILTSKPAVKDTKKVLPNFSDSSQPTTFSNSWKKNSNGNMLSHMKSNNHSTISLHISAYENADEAAINTLTVDESYEKKNENMGRIKRCKTAVQLLCSTDVIQNPFEFPRQQREANPPNPETMQFRSSQRLLNPNRMTSSSNPTASSEKKFVDRRIMLSKRFQIMQMLNSGSNVSQVAKSLNISKGGVRYVRRRAHELRSLENRPTQKRALSDLRLNSSIIKHIQEDNRIKTNKLKAKLEMEGFKINTRKLRYRINALGFKYRKMRRVQVISLENQVKRLDARRFWESQGYPFEQYLFTDECTVRLGRQQQYCWVRKGHRVPCQGRLRHGAGFHVFGGISWYGATEVLIWSSKHRMNSAFYCSHNIHDIVKPASSLFPGGDFQLIQDNHPAHVSADTMKYLKNALIKTAAWPPQSPDWNPIELLWRDMKEFIAEKLPSTMSELKETIREFWQTKVTPSYCRLLIRQAIKNIQKSYDGLNHEKDSAKDTLYQK